MTDELTTTLSVMTSDEAFTHLARGRSSVDWDTVPATIPLAGGGQVRFDRRRRQAVIDHPKGGTSVFDLGRRDRMRPGAAIVSADLVAGNEGPSWELPRRTAFDTPFGELAFRDPTSPRRRRGTASAPGGILRTWRFDNEAGQPRLILTGVPGEVATFGAFTMHDGSRYASLRTDSGLGCFYQSSRAGFMKAVTSQALQEARAEGFAEVTTKSGVIGVLFDCGAPGDYLVLSGHDREGTLTCIAVDVRRPPIANGTIVDP